MVWKRLIYMSEEINSRNCYCDSLWKNSPEFLKNEGIPFGFCGTCEFCGDFGHTQHYPGPVPYTGGWCDVCYKVEAHLSPNRQIGVWAYNSENNKELSFDNLESFNFSFLSSLLSSIKNPKSALVINHPSNFSIDFRVKPNGTYEFRFNDYDKPFFIDGDVEFDLAEKVLQIALQNKNLKDEFNKLGLHFEYVED